MLNSFFFVRIYLRKKKEENKFEMLLSYSKRIIIY